MRRRSRSAVALLVLAFSLHSQGAEVHGSVGASSDNVFRGLTLSRGQPSLLGDIHAIGTHWLGGLSAQSVRLRPRTATEAQVVAYLGYQQSFGSNWNAQWSLRHYDYLGDAYRTRYDYQEISADLSFQDRLSLALIGSPDAYAVADRRRFGRGLAYAVELNAEFPLPNALAAQLGLGYENLHPQVGASYAYWSAGLAWRWHALALSASYIGTDATARRLFGSRAGNRAVGSVLWFF